MTYVGRLGRFIGFILMIPGGIVFGLSHWLVDRSATRPAKAAGRAAHRGALSP
jgi:hypothetical protein